MRKQCELLNVARSTVSYQPVPEDPEDIRIKRLLDAIYMIDPCLGRRKLVTLLNSTLSFAEDYSRVRGTGVRAVAPPDLEGI